MGIRRQSSRTGRRADVPGALDRVLCWGFHFVSIAATASASKMVFWNIFGRPATPPRFETGLVAFTWWMDPVKLAMVEAGQPIEVRKAGVGR